MEIETVMSYIAASVNLDGVRAQEIKESLAEDIEEELGHAEAVRRADQGALRRRPRLRRTSRPSRASCSRRTSRPTSIHVIRGVIEAETGAIEHYTRIVEETDGVDPVTQDMVIAILRDEQGHRRLFEGFLREYEFEGIA